MQYAIVEFTETQEVEVVPCSWITGDKCLWPNRPSSKVQRMVKKGLPPGLDRMEYSAKVKGIFASYHDARLKLPLSELTSDIGSDVVPAKRRRKAKVFESEEEEGSFPPLPESFVKSTQGATPIRVASSKAQALSARPDARNDTQCVSQGSSYLLQPGDESDADSVISEPDSGSASVPPSSTKSILGSSDMSTRTAVQNKPADESSSVNAETRPVPLHEFQRQVLRLLNIIRLNQQQQGDLLYGFTSLKSSTVMPEQPIIVPEPLDTIEQLDQFEKQLTPETEKQLALELARLGGTSCKIAVKRMLCHLLTNKLAMLFSWLGNKGKDSFKHLKIVSIMLRGVRQIKKLEKTTEFDVETEIKSWLRHAKERQARTQKE
ncbi:uncharacterized protein LOC135378797 [Ornithodoros turicata]|uniref:uncharacterized protein LOC135378797 n=1 Tax=Ornithodoros turicata TaxID=34597 RepID=UPI0031398EB2